MHLRELRHRLDRRSCFRSRALQSRARLGKTLFEKLGVGSRRTLDAVTPIVALEAAEYTLFNGDHGEWWFQIAEAAVEEAGVENATSLQVRRYIRDNGIITPWQVRREIGRHYATARPTIGDAHLEAAIGRLHAPERRVAETIVHAAGTLEDAARRLEAMLTKADRAMMDQTDVSYLRHPGLIVETSEKHQVDEIVQEMWQFAAQEHGFGPNLALLLKADRKCAERFTTALRSLTDASKALYTLKCAFNEYNEEGDL